jgi:hypothetical protein
VDAALATLLVEQPVVTMLLVALPHPLHVTHAHARNLGSLDPGQPHPQRLQNLRLAVSSSAPFLGRVSLGSVVPPRQLPPSGLDRTTNVLIPPDN